MSQTFTTKEAAERLGITAARVRQLVLAGQLPAEKFGRDLVIHESDLESVKDRPIGRPPGKASTANKAATAKATANSGASTKKKGKR
jgi:excisionase family DNA binding protein